jgi:hypothetical protein
VHVAKAQPVRRQSVEAGRLDRAAVTAQLAESRIVQDDEQHIRGALPRPHRRRPGSRGLISGPPDHARERNARPIFNNWHADHPRCSPAARMAHILRRRARARITRHGWCGSHRAGRRRQGWVGPAEARSGDGPLTVRVRPSSMRRD